jgi:hypothetical protein
MTRIDGWSHDRWGPSGMLYTEAAFGAVALVVFLAIMAAVRGWAKTGAEPAA